MLAETNLRLPQFRPGPSIRLADGQFWTFPAATVSEPSPQRPQDEPERDADEPGLDADYIALLEAIQEAEDRSDQLRAELALAIHLLSQNYDLDPDDYQTLLGFEPGSPELKAAQEAFHELALDHLCWFPETLVVDRRQSELEGLASPILQAFDRLRRRLGLSDV